MGFYGSFWMQPLNGGEKIVYRFEGFELDPTRRLLLKEGQALQLTPKALETLLVLVRNRGRVMEKDELMQAVWPDTVVEETNLAHNISALRKVLGQKASDNRFIITAPGRGYGFVAEVQQEARGPVEEARRATEPDASALIAATPSQTATAHALETAPTISTQAPPGLLITKHHFSMRWRTALGLVILVGLVSAAGLIWLRPAPARPIRSVAVLPFKPLVADLRDEVLEMGIADTLIAQLNNLKQITVRPISAVRRYTALDQDSVAAGRELEVEAVLEGSIQKADGKIRVTARLVRVADGKPLWVRQFDEHWTDIFAVQDAISQRVAADLMATLPDNERNDPARNYTTDPEAYQLYLLGRYYWNKRSGDGIKKSIESFQQAIEKDHDYALAYVGLADAYTTLGSYYFESPLEVLPRAREAAERALQIDERLAEAHASMGKILTDFYWDWGQAEKEFQFALDLKPNYANAHHWYAILLTNMGRFDEGIREINRALELDYLSPATGTQAGAIFYRARRYDQAIAILQKTLDREPNFIPARFYLGLCYVMQEKRKEAIAEFKKGQAAAPDEPGLITILGYTAGLEGQIEQARSYQKELTELAKRRYVSPFARAAIPSGLGEWDEVFKWLEKCFEVHDPAIRSLNTDPLFDRLRKDPRFAALLHRAGLE
jgi:DNA-binding winged helix-turn-helix (wHTH) protein/TolB-like protein/Tfp pilus assembly protein PilF